MQPSPWFGTTRSHVHLPDFILSGVKLPTPTLGLAVQIGALILGGAALLDMTPVDLRLGQSQQLAVQGLELGSAGDWGTPEMGTRLVNPFIS